MRVDQDSSFGHFVYPFLFLSETFDTHAQAVRQAQWPGRERPLTVWTSSRFPEGELLPHVHHYLNPHEKNRNG